MDHRLKARLRSAVIRRRNLKPQTERHIHEYLDDTKTSWQSFFDVAADRLEEYEIETLFGPIFTPQLDELAQVSDVLLDWTPSQGDQNRIVSDLAEEGLSAEILLTDGKTATLPLHAVMIERYVKLQRLGHAPEPATASTLCDAVPREMRDYVLAIARHRAFATAERQAWYARFVSCVAAERALCVDDLIALSEFMSTQRDLSPDALASAITDAARSAQAALSAARGGHTYLSSDVAEYHHCRGQGAVDKQRVSAKQREVARLEQLEVDLYRFVGVARRPGGAS